MNCASSEQYEMEYSLSGQYSTLSGAIGLDDDSPNGYAVAHVTISDERGRKLVTASAPVGRPYKLRNLSVRGVIRLRFACIVTDTRPSISIAKLPVTLAGMELTG
jgi:hypothetical protein